MFEPLQKFLGHAARHYGISNEVKAAKVCHTFREAIGSVFDNEAITRDFVDAGYFKQGVLVVNVESPAFAHEVISRKAKIIDELNSRMGEDVVKNLRTQLKMNQ